MFEIFVINNSTLHYCKCYYIATANKMVFTFVKKYVSVKRVYKSLSGGILWTYFVIWTATTTTKILNFYVIIIMAEQF